jgi:tripeptidyl-peptidase-1
VIEFEQQYFSPKDLATFGTQVAITIQTVSASHTVGTNQPNNPQLEASLDIEMVSTANTEVTNWFWIEPGNNWLYEYAVHVFTATAKPDVQSISYGWAEFDQCAISPSSCSKIGVNSQGYVQRVNAEFQKIGGQGVSLIVASGDSGANGRTDYYCNEKHLNPDYPAASPYVLSVGATQLANAQFALKTPPPVCKQPAYKCQSAGTEQAVSYPVAGFASGGGFSNYATQPSYQTAAVNAYLKSGVVLPPASYFNTSGRGYPDVAAIGTGVLIYQGGVQVVGGTSASSPTWGSVASLLVATSIAKTGKTLGLLSPLMYQAQTAQPSCFHDITVGDNKCTEQGCAKSCTGYLCTKGWDPVTGLGSPNVQCLVNYISQLLDAKLAKQN